MYIDQSDSRLKNPMNFIGIKQAPILQARVCGCAWKLGEARKLGEIRAQIESPDVSKHESYKRTWATS